MHIFHRYGKYRVIERFTLHVYDDGVYVKDKRWTTVGKSCTVCGKTVTRKVRGVHLPNEWNVRIP